MQLPLYLKSFQEKVPKEVAACIIKDVEFSGSTYQVLVAEAKGKHEEWAFIQLDSSGNIRDSFCSCISGESLKGCIHQAAAYHYIFGDYSEPLHVRFESSLWNKLCFNCSVRYGNDPDILKKCRGSEYRLEKRGKTLFSIKGTTPDAKEFIERIVTNRRKETEETSLKFSNLSEEEIEAWHKGRPSPRLAYELSFWCDIAKRLLMEQERKGNETEIAFDYSSKKIPNELQAVFPSFKVFWNIPEEDLPSIIPGLETVRSPLKVFKDPSVTLLYNPNKKAFSLCETNGPRKKVEGKQIGDWIYQPKEGFYYQKIPDFLSDEDLSDVGNILTNHLPDLRSLLIGTNIHDSRLKLKYHLEFDSHWNLKIEAYLNTPGDLKRAGSACFDEWIYLPVKGFYSLLNKYFPELSLEVPASDVADFVSLHRTWLNMQEGFKPHLSSIESEIAYSVNEANQLIFTRRLALEESSGRTKDFGRWIYVEKHGFFSKTTPHSTHIPINAPISPEQVPLFIRTHEQDLHLVKGFFSRQCPIVKCGLTVHEDKAKGITVHPVYTFLPEYEGTPLRSFDDYVYVDGEGFHELPYAARLPERFRHTTHIDESEYAYFFTHELPRIEPYIIEIDRGLQRPEKYTLVAEEIEQIDRGRYKLKVKCRTNLGETPLTGLINALNHKERFVFTKAGLFDLHSKQFHWLNHLKKEFIDTETNTLIISPLELLRINAYQGITIDHKRDQLTQASEKLLKELTEFRSPEEPDTTGLKSTLRSYQSIGVSWLWYLYNHGLSGLLCDDMGLGKTHQTMALLMAIMNQNRKSPSEKKQHFLIVCPTSVIYHWQEKLSEFIPEFKVWTYYGAHRSLEKFYEESDILLTSYGVLRNEIDILSKMNFEVAIFDELQIAKNQTSRIYQSLLQINAKMRLGLSGTPIENRLRELKALFDIILPSYMPNEEDFKDLFIRPIEKGENPERKEMLSRLIKPFVLRRKKEDVLVDLPEKIEEIAHCDLAPEQKKLYSEVFSASREKILHELEDSKSPVPYMHIFALFSHLKQICNHPAAYLKKPSDYKKYHSGKWDLFVELLEEARESQQKVVVFSQYLSMLDIIEDYLNENDIGYATIRGATTDRGAQLARFKDDPKCEVFVGSLQAAGLGVDLTAGSVVIHYDRWWNAARENQATDRVHRIGQTRGVQVFKLMTKGTLEEHINSMIFKKGKLMEDVVGIDEHEVIKKLDRNEMVQLLQTLQKEIAHEGVKKG